MEEKNKRFKVYKVIMLIFIVAFITFLITAMGMYQYYGNNKPLVFSTNNESKGINFERYK